MNADTHHLTLRLAVTEVDRRAAERLRYDVFIEELGGDGPLVDHEGRFERDLFDPVFDHLVLVDETRDAEGLDHVVGVYRLLPDGRSPRFYSEDEYDLEPLRRTGRRLLELGRSCIRREYRGGMALPLLLAGLADYVRAGGFEILFGVASLHGTDIDALAEPLSHLYHAHLAPPDLRVRAVEAHRQPMDLIPPDRIDRVRAMKAVPPLIKSYLKLGGFVGDGAFIDRPFNTTDVCLVMDTARLSEAARTRYGGGPA
ncbi:GNAT family N-acetyltransferase [Silicimonas algicola]|uniref:L-ornithine N(alpha)-acyltransferase n=1 Tax=Silicimonas algicola TaxID=1826607 RepID=A0A316GB66_9RHOB|nr:GNAT family N-acyltransferase [Silicimonas algicola]AZQ68087.1 GNAT family N-acetyltransferase [Silicimonas algicola]PWK57455.1 ornithine-acyl[acyl carrier protein] N-acyltransferase [Silicimonas algicola]